MDPLQQTSVHESRARNCEGLRARNRAERKKSGGLLFPTNCSGTDRTADKNCRSFRFGSRFPGTIARALSAFLQRTETEAVAGPVPAQRQTCRIGVSGGKRSSSNIASLRLLYRTTRSVVPRRSAAPTMLPPSVQRFLKLGSRRSTLRARSAFSFPAAAGGV